MLYYYYYYHLLYDSHFWIILSKHVVMVYKLLNITLYCDKKRRLSNYPPLQSATPADSGQLKPLNRNGNPLGA